MPSFKAFADFQKQAQETPVPARQEANTGADKYISAFDDVAEPVKAGPGAGATTAPAGAAAPKEGLRIGMKVRVKGLQARPELNGLEGVLTYFDEQKSRWQVELKSGGAKLFKANNLEQHISDEDALAILKGKMKGPEATGGERPAVASLPGGAAGTAKIASQGQGLDAGAAPPTAGRAGPKSRTEGGLKYGSADGPSAAAVAAAAAIAKGTKPEPAGAPAAAAQPRPGAEAAADENEDDDEAFVRSIEQCLKECDVMWDDY